MQDQSSDDSPKSGDDINPKKELPEDSQHEFESLQGDRLTENEDSRDEFYEYGGSKNTWDSSPLEEEEDNISLTSDELSLPHETEEREEIFRREREIASRHGFIAHIAEATNKSHMRVMEDFHLIEYGIDSTDGQGMFAVFDGHSGKKCAQFCSENILSTYLKVSSQYDSISATDALNMTFRELDKTISQELRCKSGCTAAVVLIRTEKRLTADTLPELISPLSDTRKEVPKRVVYAANVGDTRVILCRRGKAIELTRDHNCYNSEDLARIKNKGGMIFEHRVNGMLAVTRAFGDASLKNLIISSPYTTETVLSEDDSFIIIACDGLWDVCSNQHAVDLIKDLNDSRKASKLLLKYALKARSTDNITVLVVLLNC